MKNKFNIINGIFMGITLFLALFLIKTNNSNKLILIIVPISFMLLQTMKDIVLGKMGFDFSGFGLKNTLILDFVIFVIMLAFLIYRFAEPIII